MTSHAERSFFTYPVQRTIKPIATIPREAKPKGDSKFHIDPQGNLRESSFQFEAAPRAAGMERTRHKERSKPEMEVVLQQLFTICYPHFRNGGEPAV